MPKVDAAGQTHNLCSWVSSCQCCHCHYCHYEHLRQRDKALADVADYLAELEEQKKEYTCVCKTASDRLKTILELQTELNNLRKTVSERGVWVSYEDHCKVAERLQIEREEARECARTYLPDVKHSYDDMNKGRTFEREQRMKYSWLGPPEYPIEDIP